MLRTLGTDAMARAAGMRVRLGGYARPLILGALTALMSRAQPVPGAIPFALAMLAAMMSADVPCVFALTGCLMGMFQGDGIRLEPALGTAVVVAGMPVVKWAADRMKRRGRAVRQDGGAAMLAGLAAVLPGAALAVGDLAGSLAAVGCGVAAAASVPFLRALVGVGSRRRHLMPEERAGMVILMGAGAAGLAALWPPLAMAASMIAILILSPLGAGAGACAGLGAGAAMLCAGLEPGRAAALGICGMLAGLASGRAAWQGALALSLSSAACVALLGVPWVDPVCALVASCAALTLPETVGARFRGWMSGEARGACDPDRLAARLRAQSVRRLRALSDAFGELSDSYKIPVDVPDEQSLILNLRENLCDHCPYYAGCWTGGDNRAVRFLCQLISESIDWAAGDCAEPLFGDELPPEMLRQCHRGRTIPARVGPILEEFARKRRSEMKRGAMNQLISAQFMQAQMLLGGLADAQSEPLRIRGRQAARARAALDQAGIGAGEVMALRGARSMELAVTLDEGTWSPELAARASAQLTDVFGRPYAPGERPGYPEMKFVRLPGLRAVTGAACHSCRPGTPSGDSHMILPLEGDRLVLMLSDGMGSGEAAARESAQTLRLLSRFLTADVNRELALDTVNELMLARTDSDMFATVDLCLIDLSAGTAEFTKLSACRSLILRKGEVLTVEGGRLPLGILEGVRPSSYRVKVEPGDVIIMGSDGIMDDVNGEELEELLIKNGCQPSEMLCETLLTRTHPGRSDDATVVCARISRMR